MAEAKKKTTAAKAAKTEPEVVPAVAEPKAETVEKKEEVKAETKPAAKKAPTKKTTVKKASEKKTTAKKAEEKKATVEKTEAKSTVQQSLHIQYSDKNVSMDDLQKIAADVWKYDLNKGDEEFTSLDLYVKPEENTVYYVFNGDVQGNFLI